MQLKAGYCYTYAAPRGYEHSRLIIGAIVRFEARDPVICCAVLDAHARAPDGSETAATIPFLPMTEDAFLASIVAPDGEAQIPDGFAAGLDAWRSDPRGLSIFTVPFNGVLDDMIAQQMAEIADRQSAV